MKIVALLVNAFLCPGIGTLMVGKIGSGITQIVLLIVTVILAFTIVGLIVALPLGLIVWVWSLVSVATTEGRISLDINIDKTR